jgi:hypothetical protein
MEALVRKGFHGRIASVAAAGAAAVFAMSLLLGVNQSGAKTRRGYCRQPVVHDYEQQLRGLPKVAGIPASGSLPFGPPGLRVSKSTIPWNRGRVVIGGGSFGYSLGGPTPSVPLDWNVTSRLSQLDANGTSEQTVAEARGYVEQISSISTGEFTLKAPPTPGPYLYSVSFADRSGDLLGSYGRYLAVVRPRVAVRLDIRAPYFRPGSILTSRLENLGTESIAASSRYWLSRRVGSHWRKWSSKNSRGYGGYQVVGAGAASKCLRVRLPAKLMSGHYRLSQSMWLGRLGVAGSKNLFTRSASFAVRAR